MSKVQIDEQQFIRLFNKGFEEVVLPAMEEMEGSILEKMSAGFERMERRIDALAMKLDEHEKKIKKLENKVFSLP